MNENFELQAPAPSAIESLERANVDMQIATAKKYPRSLTVVKQRMLDLATLDQETAMSCFYKLNRQGKNIEGPTIRLAEIAGSSFGNLRYGARVVSNDGKKITAQGFAHDLESNTFFAVEVSRRITTRDGATYSEDMQIVTGNAACAIAARNAMFKIVPFALVKPIYEKAKQAAVGDIKTLADRRTTMLTKFAALGVNLARVCKAVGRAGVDEIGLNDLETLIGLHNAITDGDQTVDEAFPATIDKPIIGEPKETVSPKPLEGESQPMPPVAQTTPPGEPPRKRGRKPKLTVPEAEEPAQPPTPAPATSPDDLETFTAGLNAAGYMLTQFLTLAINLKWLDAPEGEDQPTIPPEKLAQFLEPDNFEMILEQLAMKRSDKGPFA